MWRVINLLFLASVTASGKLIGDHICPEEQRYTDNVTEYFIRNITVRNYHWCLNVPPRCSFYITKVVNDSRIIEKEVTDLIEKCCPGYIENEEGNRCIPDCPDCNNGQCIEGKCSCNSGFQGAHCNQKCSLVEWGPNCQLSCKCQNGNCDPVTGQCSCYEGWTGNECQLPCPDGFFGEDCGERCVKCDVCHHVHGACPPNLNNTIIFENNGKFHSTKIDLLSTPLSIESIFPEQANMNERRTTVNYMTVPPVELFEQEQVDKNNDQYINFFTTTTERPVQVMKSSKAKVNSKEVSVTTSTTTERNILQEENYLNSSKDSEEQYHGNINHSVQDKDNFINGTNAATAITIAIVFIAIIILIVNYYKKQQRHKDNSEKGNKGISRVSTYAQSIFHSPLPEPPTFENPIFTTPEANANNGQRFETGVVYSMNFPNSKDPREYLYDHPPSNGSFQVVSDLNPPDLSSFQSLPHTEPVYDEIPSGTIPIPTSEPPPSYKSSSLYMNTYGKTRL